MWITARRVWFNHLRRQRLTRPFDEGAELLAPGPDSEDARVELLDLAPHVAKLSTTERQAVLLRAVNYSRAEIAIRLGCSDTRVHDVLKAARRRLRSRLIL
jgi:DNA-directed RNA polymerase specialized sigma24 family protein